MLQEKQAQHKLDKSIGWLQQAWMLLAGEEKFQGRWFRRRHNEIERADINGDGVVNGQDFAILTRYWLMKYDK